MQHHTKEFTFTIHPNSIIEIRTNENFEGDYTLEGAKENITVLHALLGQKTSAIIAWMPDTYMKKEIIKYYNSFELPNIATALITKSFASQLIGNLFLTLRTRLLPSAKKLNNPVKIFKKEQEAVDWLLDYLEKNTQYS